MSFWAPWWPRQKDNTISYVVFTAQEDETSPTPSSQKSSNSLLTFFFLVIVLYIFFCLSHLTLCISLKLLWILCEKKRSINNDSHPLAMKDLRCTAFIIQELLQKDHDMWDYVALLGPRFESHDVDVLWASDTWRKNYLTRWISLLGWHKKILQTG